MTRPNALHKRGIVAPITRAYGAKSKGPLAERFLFSPFSVWNTREDKWQNRKRIWLALGIESETGRDDKLTFNIPITLTDGRTGNKIRNQTSIFDPVLCELVLRWWCPPGGVVLDPFAGGSVRGIVSSWLGRKYYGIELRREQVLANRAQLGAHNTGPHRPHWVCGDSTVRLGGAPEADFLLTCPPYGNLETYSDDPKDISNKDYSTFLGAYGTILSRAFKRLHEDRFACIVVANYRDKKTGVFHDLVGDTVRLCAATGGEFYNEIILVNAVGSAAMRANGSFIRGGRKIVKSHQNVLIFVKGNPKRAAKHIPATVDDY